MIKNKDMRKAIAKVLREQSVIFKEYDKQNEQTPVYLSDIDSLFKQLKEIVLNEENMAKNRYYDDLSLLKLGILLTGYLALSFREDKCIEIDSEFIPNPNFVIGNLVVQITNHSMAIDKLIEGGLESSARAISRIVEELVFLTLYLTDDYKMIKTYSESIDSKAIWYKHFRQKHILNAISKIERASGFPDDFINELKAQREDSYSFYSDYIHSSFEATMIGAYLPNFEDDEKLNFTLFGKVTPASENTIIGLCDILFYFNLAMVNLLHRKYIFKASPSSSIVRMTTALIKSYQQIYRMQKSKVRQDDFT